MAMTPRAFLSRFYTIMQDGLSPGGLTIGTSQRTITNDPSQDIDSLLNAYVLIDPDEIMEPNGHRETMSSGSTGTFEFPSGISPTSFSDNTYELDDDFVEALDLHRRYPTTDRTSSKPNARSTNPSSLTLKERGIENKWKEAYNLALEILEVEENSEAIYREDRIEKLADLFLRWKEVYGKVEEDIHSLKRRGCM